MVGHHSRAIVLLRNRLAARRLSRILVGAGFAVEIREEAGDLRPDMDAAGHLLIVAESTAGDAALRAIAGAAAGRCAAVLCHSTDLFEISDLVEAPGVHALLACAPDGTALDLEGGLLSVALHLRGRPLAPMQAHLMWGAQAFHTEIATVEGRETAVARIVALCGEQLGTTRRIADGAGEIAHELITNAMYDAPVDARGNLRYSRDRSVPIGLEPQDQVVFRYGTDGLRLAIEASDRFGRLSRSDLNQSMRRGRSGEVSRGEGGAGIGLSRVLRACQLLQVDVEPGVRTRVTAVLDLGPPRPGDGGGPPRRSLIFPPAQREEPQRAGASVTLGQAP